MPQKGNVALIPLLLLLGVIVVAVVVLGRSGKIPTSLAPLIPYAKTVKKEPTVELKSEYQNPFDKSSQYTNPFSGYRNPFDALK